MRRTRILTLTLALAMLAQVQEPGRSGPAQARVLWQFDAGGCLVHTPVVVEDMVYVASGRGVLWQLESATGKLRWIAMMGPNSQACVFQGSLLFTPSLVLAGVNSREGNQGSIRAIERSSGEQRWMRPAGRGLAPSLSMSGHHLLVPTVDGELLSLNLSSGTREWIRPLKAGEWGSPAVAGDRVFAGAADGSVYALSAATGRAEWRTNLGAPITTAIRRGEKALFVGTRDGRVHRVSMKDGEILASRRLDGRLAPRSAPLVEANSLFLQLADENAEHQALVAVERDLSRVRWRVAAMDRWTTTRVVAWRNTVAVGTADGHVLAYCGADGSPAWTHRSQGTIRAIGASDDSLYIGTSEGLIEAVRPPTVCGGGN